MRRRGIYNTLSRKGRRNNLRNHGTPAEAVLWMYLRNRQLAGKKFRRQYGVGPFIVDFYCPECRLAVELDGSHHFPLGGNEYDALRTSYLVDKGIRVLRFENRIVFEDPESVLEAIRNSIK